MARTRKDDHPGHAVSSLAARVEREGLPRGLVLRGEERYFHERAIELVRRRGEADGFEVVAHDAAQGPPDFSLARLLDDLSGGGLFAARRLVVVRQPDALLRKEEGSPSALTRTILAFLQEPDAGCIVLSAGSLRVDHPVSKAILAAGGAVLDLRRLWESPPPWSPDPRQAELVQWVLERGRELGVTLEVAQAVYLAAATGNDLSGIDDQLERVKNAPGSGWRDAVGWDATTAPWTVAERILDGDAARALGQIETLHRGGFQDKSGRRVVEGAVLANLLFGALERGARQCWSLATELARGAEEEDALRAAGVQGPPMARKGALARARLRSPSAWADLLGELLALERRMKSGGEIDANDFVLLALRWGVRAPDAGGARRGLRSRSAAT